MAIATAFLVLYLMSYPRSLNGRQTFTSPRENVGYLLAEQFANGRGFRYPLRYYGALPPDVSRALTPRDAAEVGGAAVPKDYAGTMLLYGVLLAIWKPLALGVAPLFAVLSAFVLARIGQALFDSWVGFLTLPLWLAFPALSMNASYIFTGDTVALWGFLVAILFFCRYWISGQRRDYVWMSLAIGFSILMRYPNVLAVIPIAIALLLTGRVRWSEGALGLGLLAPFLATILAFNEAVYGRFDLTGYGLGVRLLSQTANPAGRSLIQFHPDVVAAYMRNYLLDWPILLGPPLLGLLWGTYVFRHAARFRGLVFSLLATSLVLALYYFPVDAWGVTRPVVNASVLRYLLPALAIWMLFLAHGILRLLRRRALVGALLIVLIWGFVESLWAGPGGVSGTRREVEQLQALRRRVLAVTAPNSLIATSRMDKVLFPERQTLTLTYLLRNQVPLNVSGEAVWDVFPDRERFAEVALAIFEQGIPFYLLTGSKGYFTGEYNRTLRPMGLMLQRVKHMRLYKLVPLAPP